MKPSPIHLPSYALEAINMCNRASRRVFIAGCVALIAFLVISLIGTIISSDECIQWSVVSAAHGFLLWACAAYFKCQALTILNAELTLKLEKTQIEWRPGEPPTRKRRLTGFDLN